VPVYDEQFRIQKQDGKVIREENYPYYFHNVKEDQRPVDGNATTLWAPT
jgi:POT family proton-dependent oligopeptide transporter